MTDLKTLWRPVAAMTLVIVLSNVAVQFPINDWLTWGPSPTRWCSWSAT
jgi:uncharacterized PurR-regulated membrane protein YhhQ (DUF165 family)